MDRKKGEYVQVLQFALIGTGENIGEPVEVKNPRQQARTDEEIRQDYLRCGKDPNNKYRKTVELVEAAGGWDKVFFRKGRK